jgi:hypothetical protein
MFTLGAVDKLHSQLGNTAAALGECVLIGACGGPVFSWE